MKNIKKVLLALMLVVAMLVFAGCTKTKTNDDGQGKDPVKAEIVVTFNIYNFDGTLLVTKDVKTDATNEGKKVAFDLLKANFDVQYTESEWGPYITSINGSETGDTLYLALYENGQMSSVGIAEVEVNDKDVIDFKVEDWAAGQITVTFNIYKLDGTLLASKVVMTDASNEGKKIAFDLLKANFDVKYTESEWGPFITSIDGSETGQTLYLALYENGEMSMVGISEIIVNDKDVIDFKVEDFAAGCISVTYNVYDINDELLTTKVIFIDEENEGKKIAFDLLDDNCDVVYTESEWGPYITSIDGSVVDPKYYLALYENGEMSMVGISDIEVNDKDVYDFKVECWDTTFTELDLKIDKIIYSFMKNYLEKVFTEQSYGYTLYQAIVKMSQLGYDPYLFDLDKIPNLDKYKETWLADLTGGTVGQLFRASLGCVDYDLTNDTIKPELEKQTDADQLSIIWTIGYFLDACYNVGLVTDTYNLLLDKFAQVMKDSTPSDSVNMAIQIYALFNDREEYQATIDALMEAQKTYISVDGFKDEWTGNNAASTAQAILAMVASGVDPRSYNDINLMEVLLKYENNGGFKHTVDAAYNDYDFDTPDSIAALLMYKAYRDLGASVSVYDVVK